MCWIRFFLATNYRSCSLQLFIITLYLVIFINVQSLLFVSNTITGELQWIECNDFPFQTKFYDWRECCKIYVSSVVLTQPMGFTQRTDWFHNLQPLALFPCYSRLLVDHCAGCGAAQEGASATESATAVGTGTRRREWWTLFDACVNVDYCDRRFMGSVVRRVHLDCVAAFTAGLAGLIRLVILCSVNILYFFFMRICLWPAAAHSTTLLVSDQETRQWEPWITGETGDVDERERFTTSVLFAWE